MTHRVTFSGAARRQLEKLPRAPQERLLAAAEALSDEPRPDGCRKLAGQSAWRIRVGAFRMIYEVEDAELVVLVLRVGDRKDIYKKNRRPGRQPTSQDPGGPLQAPARLAATAQHPV